MADAFISWSSPDEHIVKPIVERLRQAGYTLLEYSADHVAGSIDQMVQGYIQDAEIALIFVSERSAKKQWIQIETDWCVQMRMFRAQQMLPQRPIIMPVMIGS